MGRTSADGVGVDGSGIDGEAETGSSESRGTADKAIGAMDGGDRGGGGREDAVIGRAGGGDTVDEGEGGIGCGGEQCGVFGEAGFIGDGRSGAVRRGGEAVKGESAITVEGGERGTEGVEGGDGEVHTDTRGGSGAAVSRDLDFVS